MSSESEQKWRSTSPSRNVPAGAGTLAPGLHNPMGFDQTADNHMYNELRSKVMAEERERRISQGLSPDPPGKLKRLKMWLLNREEQPADIVSADVGCNVEVQKWPSADKRSSRSSDRRRSSAVTKTRTTSEHDPGVDVAKIRASVERRSVDKGRVEDWWA